MISNLSKTLNIVSLVISIICVVFFIVAASGYSDQRDVVENASWIASSENGVKIYVGTRKVYSSAGGVDTSFKFSYDSCTGDYCDACETDGQAAFGLMIIACFCSALVIIQSGYLIAISRVGVQISNVFFSFLAACTSLISVGFFMGECYDKLETSTDGMPNIDFHWGPGSVLAIIGMFLMWFVLVLQIFASTTTSDAIANSAGGSGKAVNRFN
mmetsp:Transcript_60396/g.118853  ORF Transcript_60396/g.118853 Transcript_60396/m.118853 type:complete len:214 (+) Transcript_60396:45-686(+)